MELRKPKSSAPVHPLQVSKKTTGGTPLPRTTLITSPAYKRLGISSGPEPLGTLGRRAVEAAICASECAFMLDLGRFWTDEGIQQLLQSQGIRAFQVHAFNTSP